MPARDERRQLAQAIGALPERRQRAIGGLAQLRGELARAVTPLNDTNVVFLRVGAHRLAGLRRIARDVEQVVDDLEREPEVLGEGAEPRPLVRGRARASARPAVGRRHEERAGLAAMDPLERLEVDRLIGRLQIGACPPISPSSPTASRSSAVSARDERRLVGPARARRTRD